MKKKAMILAAGLGTRMKPLTDHIPKALVLWNEKPLIEWVISRLKDAGFEDIIINLHHFPEQIIHYLESKDNFGVNICFSHEKELLDTGGGIRKAAWFFDSGPVLIHNVDIYTTLDLNELYNFHLKNKSLATLVVKNRETSRNLLSDNRSCLAGWHDNRSGETILCRNYKEDLRPVAFSGIHVIDPVITELLTEQDPFSIIKAYLRIAEEKDIRLYRHDNDTWIDMSRKTT